MKPKTLDDIMLEVWFQLILNDTISSYVINNGEFVERMGG